MSPASPKIQSSPMPTRLCSHNLELNPNRWICSILGRGRGWAAAVVDSRDRLSLESRVLYPFLFWPRPGRGEWLYLRVVVDLWEVTGTSSRSWSFCWVLTLRTHFPLWTGTQGWPPGSAVTGSAMAGQLTGLLPTHSSWSKQIRRSLERTEIPQAWK